ncbi:hypothetical protein [Nocardia sp. CNY236]|uniref:hypothetical protein n=1 Tax=Nocardia sp. CNY236 TaxID=1169152 RepID=UPI0003FA3936|nr:hypothetical protein [Nocardia sp. CNY236]
MSARAAAQAIADRRDTALMALADDDWCRELEGLRDPWIASWLEGQPVSMVRA